jgi:RND family efflux transporter MFP subunit
LVTPGQRVKKGDLLISLKGTMEKRALELADKNLKSLLKELEHNRKLFQTRDITKPELQKLEREVIQATSKLEEQRKGLENVEIRATVDGLVGVPRVVLGESVEPGMPIISITEGPYSVLVNIPGPRLRETNPGQPITMKSLVSTISAVEKNIDPITRVGFATATFKDCSWCIVGDSVFVHINVYDKPNAILLPKKAIFYQSGTPRVVVIKKSHDKLVASIREVGLGEEQAGLVEIVSGLSSGDEVVIANPKRIPDGATVTVAK